LNQNDPYQAVTSVRVPFSRNKHFADVTKSNTARGSKMRRRHCLILIKVFRLSTILSSRLALDPSRLVS